MQNTGHVILRRQLDYESLQSFQLPVHVTDGDFSADATLVVSVADVNDEAPRFEINPLHLVAEEGTSPQKLIGQVREDYLTANNNGLIEAPGLMMD